MEEGSGAGWGRMEEGRGARIISHGTPSENNVIGIYHRKNPSRCVHIHICILLIVAHKERRNYVRYNYYFPENMSSLL